MFKLAGIFSRYFSSSSAIPLIIPNEDFSYYKLASIKPKLQVEATASQLLDAFYHMNVIRKMEIAADSLYKSKLIRGFLHLYVGQEAVAVGMESSLSKETDPLITAYRCHAFAYTRGHSVRSILAELLGRKDGVSKGKGGSMHLYGPQQFFGGNGIVGAQVPVGAGLAFAIKYKSNLHRNSKLDGVALALYGDGAANQGQVFEAFNMAALWKLPCIFVCENNHYGMGTSDSRSSASTDYYARCDYIPGIRVNGSNWVAVREATRFAKEWALEGNGPIILEMDTYRYQGHSMSDPGTTYRSREEIQTYRQSKDCITNIRQIILNSKCSDENSLKELEKKAKVLVDEAVEFAKNSPEPNPEALFQDIYVGENENEQRGVLPRIE